MNKYFAKNFWWFSNAIHLFRQLGDTPFDWKGGNEYTKGYKCQNEK